ncbi:MAG: HAMP domain-containing protein [Phycisphaerae bacterium]|nr:HAMP domain-containing protein [Phycisphaerae bacterium]
MSLRLRIPLMVLVTVGAYVPLDYAIQRWIVLPSFEALEREEAIEDMERSAEAIHRELYHLSTTLCFDWASWDDTYQFVQDRNSEYIKANLVLSTFTKNNLNLLYVVNTNGELVWGEAHDCESGELIEIPQFPPSGLPPDHPLLAFGVDGVPLDELVVDGIYRTEMGPMLIVSRPILTSEITGPPRGALIMGRFLDDALVKTIAEQTRVDFHVWAVGKKPFPKTAKEILKEIDANTPRVIREDGENVLQVYSVLNDIVGKPAVLMRANLPREITPRGKTAMNYDRLLTLGVLLAMVGVLLVLLQRMVIGPIATLSKHARSVARDGDLRAQLDMDRNDEIGVLAFRFNSMLKQLREAQERQMEESYYSGMAALTSKALRDIDSAIDPVILQLSELRGDLESAPLEQIRQAKTRLSEDGPSSPHLDDLSRLLSEADEALAKMTHDAKTRVDDLLERTTSLDMILSDPRYFKRTTPNP